jgi:hypothetical protein
MTDANRLAHLALIVAGAVILAVGIARLRGAQRTVELTADRIHEQLDALDPLVRSAVIARLTADAAKNVKARVGRT